MQRASADGDAEEVFSQLLKAAHDRGLERALLQADGVYSLTFLMGHSNVAQLLLTHMPERQVVCGVFYSCLGHRKGAYNPCPKWARIYRLTTESGSKAFPASRAPEV